MEWHVAIDGQEQGPVSGAQLRQMASSGRLSPTDLVWKEGMKDWVPASKVKGLFVSENPYSAPASMDDGPPPLSGSGRAGQRVVYAAFGTRFVAALLDGIITMVGSFIVGFVFGAVMAAGGTADLQALELMGNLLGMVIAWLYSAVMESSPAQATLGKMAMGIKVTDLDGGPISFGRATGRHFGKIISGLLLLIGYIMAAFTERKQALHDIMAGCLVVRK